MGCLGSHRHSYLISSTLAGDRRQGSLLRGLGWVERHWRLENTPRVPENRNSVNRGPRKHCSIMLKRSSKATDCTGVAPVHGCAWCPPAVLTE